MGISVGEKGGWNWLGLRSGLGPAFGTSVPSIDPSLIGWWSPSNDPSPGGSVLTDLSGNGFDGQLTNMDPTTDWLSDADGNSLSFDGVNDFVHVGGRSELNPAGPFSISLWFKSSSTGSSNPMIAKYRSSTGQRGYLLRGESSGRIAFYYQSQGSSFNASQVVRTAGGFFDGAWHHVVCNFNPAQEASIFIDGILEATTTASVPASVASNSADFQIGKFDNDEYSGELDDIRYYDRLLPNNEITNLATGRGT